MRLQKNICLTFSSCSLSQNGTNVQRGQLPYFLYSIDADTSPKKNSNNLLGSAKSIPKAPSSENASQLLFIQLIRILSQKLCRNFVSIFDSTTSLDETQLLERKLARQLVIYANGKLFKFDNILYIS